MNNLKIWESDLFLEPFWKIIEKRQEQAALKEREFRGTRATLGDAVNGHLFYGLHRTREGWIFREWAPNATAIYLTGDFSAWEKKPAFALQPAGSGNWEISLPAKALKHLDLYKLLVAWRGGQGERLPSYVSRAVQDGQTKLFSAQVWQPAKAYKWKYAAPPRLRHPLIYEAHIGMSSEEERVATFDEFRRNVLPRIVKLGYNALQLMGIQEHPYYGSFGYQVSNFFAVSSRFGTPDELKRLIDEAHRHNIAVILDIVHSHAVKNELEGLSRFDGTEYQYFHSGEKGRHPVWNSRCFDYGSHDVLHFLLSNCKYWLSEFHFDGFRFDGVTSMIYCDHGIGRNFTDYSLYYDGNQDEDALTDLFLANRLSHECRPDAVTIAEDVSGMPGLAAPVAAGGTGFDFRMSMGVADFWIKTITEKRDEQWHVGDMFHELTNKRLDEHTVSYAESHDQAMVGDKTIIFRLLDREMYSEMDIFHRNLRVDRGMALHKMIRLLSLATAGDGYLNFMGNEFGHPEWIDFPREGNGWSYRHARRLWHLAGDRNLRYRFLDAFDAAMMHLCADPAFFERRPFALVQHIADQVLIFKRGGWLFTFNFNPVISFDNYRFEAEAGTYRTLLDSDAARFDGFARADDSMPHCTSGENGKNFLRLYLPSRTAMALYKVES
ncbi:MAG: alpha amylase C-terminal domain-containing protein [Prevotellaceae bacterium]|jgi:1,4-alpha-glucan branching enzyme|nr:alpha amylase C-terminal domain-containing protein [Prevotellaceae bacterium]